MYIFATCFCSKISEHFTVMRKRSEYKECPEHSYILKCSQENLN